MSNKAKVRGYVWSLPVVILLASPTQAADLVAPAPAVAPGPGYFDLNVLNTGEVWQNNGGIKSGTDFMYGIDASLSLNAEKLLGLQDAKVYIEGFYVGGKSLDFNYTGSYAAPSALDAFSSNNYLKLYQLFYEQKFGGTDVLVGKYDIQTQFATTRPMELFGNRAQGINVTTALAGVPNLYPSIYPFGAVGFRVKQTLNDQWAVKVGLVDGEADSSNGSTTGFEFKDKFGVMGIGEIDYTPKAGTKLMAGVWGETGQLSELGRFSSAFVPLQKWGEVGGYVGGATRVYTIEGARGVDAFFNAGFAPEVTNIVSKSFDAGFAVTGLIAERPSDKLGVAFNVADVSPGYRTLQLLAGNHIGQYETDFELTYRAKITNWLTVQPEVDYIINPSLGNGRNAFVYGLHFEVHNEFID